MTRVISAASCFEHARKQKEKGVPWGGVRMLRRCEGGKETSGREIRGGRRAGDVGWRRDVGKVRRHIRTQSALGMESGRGGRRGRKNDVGCIWTLCPHLRRRINFCRCSGFQLQDLTILGLLNFPMLLHLLPNASETYRILSKFPLVLLLQWNDFLVQQLVPVYLLHPCPIYCLVELVCRSLLS